MKDTITTLVFDLDGTLVKSHKNIYDATVHSFNQLKVKFNLPEDEFNKKIGHHFEDIFNDFGIIVDDFEEFINVYKKAYFEYIDSSELYDNVEEILDQLKAREFKIALLTTKGQDQADRIINHFNLGHNFDYIMGRRPGIAHKPAPDMLLKICEELHSDPKNTLMIGDTELDILCGKNAGSKTCGVTYGYRTKEEVQNLNPDFVIDELSELLKFL
ncbi:MAG: HAD family hydrolase [Melioribacteraceae bacterium]|nr:HAD family hydrolase [Melioribacteraceae bacterium]